MMMMMDCSTAAEHMLVAAVPELRGVGDSELARHVRTCASCRDSAAVIVAAQARLDHALTTLTALNAPQVSQRRTAGRPVAAVVLPLAAAAALFLITLRVVDRADEPLLPILMPPERVVEVPVVNAQAGRNVAVMRTQDPRITVVWYY